MKFIHNIKYNYYKKVINDLIIEKKYEELKKELLKIYHKSPILYYLYLKDFYQSYREINILIAFTAHGTMKCMN